MFVLVDGRRRGRIRGHVQRRGGLIRGPRRGLIRGPWRGRGWGRGRRGCIPLARIVEVYGVQARGVSFEYARAGYLGARVRASSSESRGAGEGTPARTPAAGGAAAGGSVRAGVGGPLGEGSLPHGVGLEGGRGTALGRGDGADRAVAAAAADRVMDDARVQRESPRRTMQHPTIQQPRTRRTSGRRWGCGAG